jgi:hypothetical protein
MGLKVEIEEMCIINIRKILAEKQKLHKEEYRA